MVLVYQVTSKSTPSIIYLDDPRNFMDSRAGPADSRWSTAGFSLAGVTEGVVNWSVVGLPLLPGRGHCLYATVRGRGEVWRQRWPVKPEAAEVKMSIVDMFAVDDAAQEGLVLVPPDLNTRLVDDKPGLTPLHMNGSLAMAYSLVDSGIVAASGRMPQQYGPVVGAILPETSSILKGQIGMMVEGAGGFFDNDGGRVVATCKEIGDLLLGILDIRKEHLHG